MCNFIWLSDFQVILSFYVLSIGCVNVHMYDTLRLQAIFTGYQYFAYQMIIFKKEKFSRKLFLVLNIIWNEFKFDSLHNKIFTIKGKIF